MSVLTRTVVVASTLLAVALGLWPLQAQPSLAAALGGTFVAVAMLARFLPSVATGLVLAFAYITYGVTRLVAGPEVAGMPFFLAAFAGLALGTGSWTRWAARAPWRMPLAWWGTGVALTWPYVAARELQFSLTPSLAAGPIVTSAALQMSLALWMDRLLAERDDTAFFRDDHLPLRAWHLPLMLSALATAGAALYQDWVDIAWLSGEPWTGLGRAVGMMGDANPLGVATALWAPVVVGAFATSPAPVVFGVALALPLWMAAWASGSRSSLILFGAGTAALTLLAISRLPWSRRVIVAAAGIAAIGVGAAVALLPPQFGSTTPVGRALSGRASPADLAYEILWRRDGYGIAAVEAIKEYPLFGVGIGRFAALSTAYAVRAGVRPIPPDNAQNLWRHTLAEQGLLGLLPILWLTVLTIASVLTSHADGMDLMWRVMLAGLGASLMVGYPVQDPAIAVTVAMVIAVVDRGSRRTAPEARRDLK